MGLSRKEQNCQNLGNRIRPEIKKGEKIRAGKQESTGRLKTDDETVTNQKHEQENRQSNSINQRRSRNLETSKKLKAQSKDSHQIQFKKRQGMLQNGQGKTAKHLVNSHKI